MTRTAAITLVVLLGATAPGVVAHAQTYTYAPINAPNSVNTAPRDINNLGVVVGRSSATASFKDADGVFTNVAIPNSTRVVARGVNGSGAIVGFYKPTGPAGNAAFVKTSGGLSIFNYAGADATSGTGINDYGSFVGAYTVAGVSHAFQYVGGAASEIVIAGSTSATATGINNSGDIVGYYTDAASNTLGFLSHNNTITSFAVPGSVFTAALGINNNGDIVGAYTTVASSNEHAFAKLGDLYTLLSVPQSIYANPTVTNATGINDAGVIVGYSGLAGQNFNNGFMATPVAGAPLDIALNGGSAAAPVALPLSEIVSVSGAIGGGVSSQFYSFNWGGGAFGANLFLDGAAQSMSYGFKLCAGATCGAILDSATLDYANNWTGGLSADLTAGTYTIGLFENGAGIDPSFRLSFRSAVSSATPEPVTWALMVIGFGSVGAVIRARRRRAVAVLQRRPASAA